ncbi:signal transduction histidine kinase [Paenibacillus phyllosphaerae]|uniref:histidine kinase n=1 Tax=Paenibacillus phyllosphaerae TaxID=274593 RepID=A0A7W5FNT7_9BACL|nr:HAMP domain-containing sensor histidine kinase [Paenibacillus phyllosphaerae]MBB3111344.1 signal transduction histidine kinase [Paenibacillus phyllosphaerae]
MKVKSVVVKLFLLTSSVFIVLFLLMSVGQLLFFEDFYKHQQFKALKENTREFAAQYQMKKGDTEMVDAISAFLNENKAQLVVVDRDGNYLFDNPFKIVIALADGTRITIPLYVYRHHDQLMTAGLKTGDTISVTGLFQYEGNKEIFYSTQIKKNDGAVISRKTEHSLTSMQVLTGRIVHFVLPRADQWNIREGILNFAVTGNFPLADAELQTLEAGNRVTKEWVEPWSNAENLILLHPIMEGRTLSSIVMVVSSVAELQTTYASLKIYYLYFGIGGILLILLLSVFYSRVVAKPLLTINDMAIRLEGMDFTAVQPLKRQDEFGLLSRNLSSLAVKLDAALTRLREMNSRLVSDIERKEELERIQRAFISDISHELKTPLSIIRSYAEGLRDGVAEERRDVYTDTIIDECERMETLILNMLLLMRHDSQMTLFQPEPIALTDLLERTCRLMNAQLTGKQHRCTIHAKPDISVVADPALMERVMLNLLSNAIRHADPGSEIAIQVDEHTPQGVRVNVANQGARIPDEHIQRVWDRFYQAAASRSRNVTGSGLGLAIVMQIVRDHGQTCGVYNTENGVVFWFTLERYGEQLQL